MDVRRALIKEIIKCNECLKLFILLWVLFIFGTEITLVAFFFFVNGRLKIICISFPIHKNVGNFNFYHENFIGFFF
jgi:hypothetical protein